MKILIYMTILVKTSLFLVELFIFKVNYSKSMKFLDKIYEESALLKNSKVDDHNQEEKDIIKINQQWNSAKKIGLKLERKAYSETCHKNSVEPIVSLHLYDTPSGVNCWQADGGRLEFAAIKSTNVFIEAKPYLSSYEVTQKKVDILIRI